MWLANMCRNMAVSLILAHISLTTHHFFSLTLVPTSFRKNVFQKMQFSKKMHNLFCNYIVALCWVGLSCAVANLSTLKTILTEISQMWAVNILIHNYDKDSVKVTKLFTWIGFQGFISQEIYSSDNWDQYQLSHCVRHPWWRLQALLASLSRRRLGVNLTFSRG